MRAAALFVKKTGIPCMLLCCLLAAAGCNTTKHLKEGERLVVKNSVKIVSKEKIANKNDLLYELSTHYKQKPNGKFLGMFRARLWFYYRTDSPADTTKWDNWVRRVVAEPPTIHRPELTEGTAEAMRSYLQHKGYFNARVEFESDTVKGKMVKNTYTVYPYRSYTFRKIEYSTDDSLIQRIISENPNDRIMKPGAPVDVALYDGEVARLVRLMRNKGYLDFAKNYIAPLAVDTADFQVDATLRLLSPSDSTQHQAYTIGKVYVYPNYNPDMRGIYEVDGESEGVTYMSVGSPNVRYNILERNILLREGQGYRYDDEAETKKRLATLGLYKFISIKSEKNDSLPGVVDFRIYLPSKKRMALSGDLEINTGNNTTLNNTSLGTGVNLNYLNRNLFKGAEVFNMGIQSGLEFALRDSARTFNAVDVGLSSDLAIPKFVDYLGIFSLANALRILPERNYQNLRQTAVTRFKLGYDYLLFIDFYDYHSMEASVGFDIKPNDRWRLRFTQSGLTYFNPSPQPDFETILADNEFLRRSFGNQLFTGLLARDVQASLTGKPNKRDVDWSLRLSGELSGAEVLSMNKIFSPNTEWRLFENLEFAHYSRLDVEGKYTKNLTKSQGIAFRGTMGLALPFGYFPGASPTVPYAKQFHVGGPNSIRAWSIREIGPGGYVDPISLDPSNSQPFYQTGDLRMEVNAEYRFPLFWLIHGAWFLDMGNVWTLSEDTSRPGAKISQEFWRQFAVGSGLGLRLDFSFFILRFDVGYPIRNNYPDPISGSYWKYGDIPQISLGRINYNLAIGYPF